jgi:carboxylesterase type B
MESEASGASDGHVSYHKLAAALGCTQPGQLACMRAAPAKKIKNIIEHQEYSFGPVPDGKTMVQDVRPNIKNGIAAKIPIILGTNKDEGSAFMKTGLSVGNITVGGVLGSFAGSTALGEKVVAATRAFYPKTEFATDLDHGVGLFTDLGFQCPAQMLAQTFADAGYSVRRYFYAGRFPEIYPFENAGAWHSAEIAPVFGNYDSKFSDIDHTSNIIQKIWTGFARDPEAEIEDWPVVTKTEMPVLEFGKKEHRTVKSSDLDKRCFIIGPMAASKGI